MHRDRGVGTARGWKHLPAAALLVAALGCGGPESAPKPPEEEVVLTHPQKEPAEEPSAGRRPAPEARPWFQRLGGPQDDTAAGLAVDGEGALTLVWLSTPREDQDREGVPGQRRALTLTRYGLDGESRWSHEFPRMRVDAPRVGTSPRGDVFLSGNASLHAVDLGLGAARDGFLVKFSPEGEPRWQRRVGQKVWGLAADGEGGVLVVGEEWTPAGPLPVLAHHDAQGAFRWTRQLDVVGEGSALHAVALAPSGRTLLAGRLVGTLGVDGHTFGQAGGRSLVLLAFEPDGRLAWGRELRGVEGHVTGLTVAPDGAGVLVGESHGDLRWAGRTLGGRGAFVLMAGPDGAEHWGQSLACGESPAPPVVAVEAAGSVVAACGGVLSRYSAQGTPGEPRQLSSEGCATGPCPVSSTALAVLPGGGLGLAGFQRHGGDAAWDQDAFLRIFTP
jgi:hypothetical protein